MYRIGYIAKSPSKISPFLPLESSIPKRPVSREVGAPPPFIRLLILLVRLSPEEDVGVPPLLGSPPPPGGDGANLSINTTSFWAMSEDLGRVPSAVASSPLSPCQIIPAFLLLIRSGGDLLVVGHLLRHMLLLFRLLLLV